MLLYPAELIAGLPSRLAVGPRRHHPRVAKAPMNAGRDGFPWYSYAALRFSLARRRLPFHSVLILYRALIMATQRAIASVGPLP